MVPSSGPFPRPWWSPRREVGTPRHGRHHDRAEHGGVRAVPRAHPGLPVVAGADLGRPGLRALPRRRHRGGRCRERGAEAASHVGDRPHPRRPQLLGRRLVLRGRPPRLPAPHPAQHHLLPAGGPGGLLPPLPSHGLGDQQGRPRRRRRGRARPEPRAGRGLRPPRRPHDPPALRQQGGLAGDGADGAVPGQLRPELRLQRGHHARPRRGLPVVPDATALAARRHPRRSGHRQPARTPSPSSPRASSPPSWPSCSAGSGRRCSRRCWPPSAGSRSSCSSPTRPASATRGSGSRARRGTRARASGSRRSETSATRSSTRSTRPATCSRLLCVAAMLFGLWATWKRPLPLPVTVYTIGILALMLLPQTVTRPPPLPLHRVPAPDLRRRGLAGQGRRDVAAAPGGLRQPASRP